jgi:predicted enzyme related to lactoylglutathione lyase
VPRIEAYRAGTPCWVDVSSPDLEATAAFYTTLFGWSAERAVEPEAGGYTMFLQDGSAVAAAAPNRDDWPVMWNTYVASDDVDATATAVEQAGGRLLMPPFDVMGFGRMTFAFDPAGASFGVWQAGTHHGAQLVNEPVSLAWSELSTPDEGVAQAFYGAVFGWEPERLGEGDRNAPFVYTLEKIDGRPVAGVMKAGAQREHLPSAWTAYFAVADADAIAGQASALGARVVAAATDSPYGRMAVLADPHGAVFAVIALAAPAA